MKKDIGKSIRTRLLNLANNEKIDYMKILIRYFHERLLYRISNSSYKKNFLLKGSSLIFAYDMFKARPTVDVDLLGHNINREEEYIKNVFEEICQVNCKEDGVIFHPDSIKIGAIALEKKYPGNNVKITATMDSISQQISIDIGYGDIVTPYPLPLEYPPLLTDIPTVDLYAYSLETLIAEKFHAMIQRDNDNSRMKDFFDIYHLFKNHSIDENLLKDAILNTFNNRDMEYTEGKSLFTKEFESDEFRNTMWQAFLKKIKWSQELPFTEVMKVIREKLSPYWNPSINKQ